MLEKSSDIDHVFCFCCVPTSRNTQATVINGLLVNLEEAKCFKAGEEETTDDGKLSSCTSFATLYLRSKQNLLTGTLTSV